MSARWAKARASLNKQTKVRLLSNFPMLTYYASPLSSPFMWLNSLAHCRMKTSCCCCLSSGGDEMENLKKRKHNFLCIFFIMFACGWAQYGLIFCIALSAFSMSTRSEPDKKCCPLSRSRREIRLDAIGKKFTIDWIFFVSRVRGHAFATIKEATTKQWAKTSLIAVIKPWKKTLSYFIFVISLWLGSDHSRVNIASFIATSYTLYAWRLLRFFHHFIQMDLNKFQDAHIFRTIIKMSCWHCRRAVALTIFSIALRDRQAKRRTRGTT